MCVVLQHPKTILTVFAGVEVMILQRKCQHTPASRSGSRTHLQPVHLAISLGAPCADCADEWPISFFCLLDRKTEIDRFDYSIVALAAS